LVLETQLHAIAAVLLLLDRAIFAALLSDGGGFTLLHEIQMEAGYNDVASSTIHGDAC
jgi:hypothetical protein